MLRTTGALLKKDCLHLCSPAKEEMSQDLSALSSSWCPKGQFFNIEEEKKKKSKELCESDSPKGQLAEMVTLLEILLFHFCFLPKLTKLDKSGSQLTCPSSLGAQPFPAVTLGTDPVPRSQHFLWT